MKRKTMMLFALLIAGCSVPAAVPAQSDPGHVKVADIDGTDIYKFNDRTNGVTCYLANHYAFSKGTTSVSINCVFVGPARQ